MSNFAVSLPEVIAVLPAAGIGSRMLVDCPKQYLTVGGKTIIEHAIFSLLHHPRIQRVIVVIHPQDTQFSRLSVAQDPRISTVYGGDQRANSVMAGLQLAGQAEWVLVHDAARPCLHLDDLSRLLSITECSQVGGFWRPPCVIR